MSKLVATLLVLGCTLTPLQSWGAEITGAVGVTSQGGPTYRLGVGFDWNTTWWKTSSGQITGY